MKNSLLFSILIFGFSSAVYAAKMDSETQTQVIERLERVLSRMEKTDSSYNPSRLRLADLLSERARLRFMNEVEAGCQGCKGSVADRKRALALYEELLPTFAPDRQGAVLFQMAHLYDLAGENARARGLYEGILKTPKKYDAELIRQVRTALADLLFQQSRFKEALVHYQLAFQDPKTANRGLILYRMAWCQFNLDHLPVAIQQLEKLAGSPSFLTKDSPQGPVHDSAFQNDVMRDLATFYSRQPVSKKEIAKYQKLVPPEQRKELLLFFAGEADRLGQKQAASDIYHAYLDLPDLTPEERLDASVKLTQVTYDKGQSSKSIQDFAAAAQAFKDIRCSENEKCVELQKRMKRYVTELHRSKKAKPDMDVLKAYAIYAKTFPDDTEMAVLGAQVASGLNQSGMAVLLYHHAAASARDPKLREEALVGEIEAAEKSQDLQARENSYKNYLQTSPTGAKSFEVRYQLAHLSYEKKDWKQAAENFRTLALEQKGGRDLRKKSADLALDSLVVLKDEPRLETWSAEFASVFPESRTEYLQISRKSVMNQTAATTNDTRASRSELRSALEKMRSVPLQGISDGEKKTLLKNQAVLAEKVDDEPALMASLNGLLALKSLSATEREEAWARKVGWYEKKLAFSEAYATALKMRFPGLSKAEKELRLGTLADLAGLKPQKHYQAALSAGLKGERALALRERLVLLSPAPLIELRRQKTALAPHPRALSETVILVYGRTRNLKALQEYVSLPAMKPTAAAKFLRKQPFLAAQKPLQTRLASHRLETGSDRLMQKSIRARIELLKQADRNLSEAVKLKDFAAQVLALNLIATENERMVRDLASLPVPKGLTPAQTDEYLNLMKQQSRPYLVKARYAEKKRDELWSDEAAVRSLASDFEKSRPEIRPLLRSELQLLTESPDSNARSARLLRESLSESQPSPQDLLNAREQVRQNPDDTGRIEKLKNLETKIGHPLMSSYLEGRLGQIQKEKVL